MSDTFYIINKKVLPNYFEKVIEIKKMVNAGSKVIDACKMLDLSRATYYKYKDYVNEYSERPISLVNISLKMNKNNIDSFINLLNKDIFSIISINRINLNENVTRLSIILYTYNLSEISNIINSFDLLDYEINIIEDNIHFFSYM